MTISSINQQEPAPEPGPAAVQDEALAAIMAHIGNPLTQAKNIKGMIYSRPGVGKTTLIAGIPKALMIDAEDGNIVLTPQIMAPGFERTPFFSFEQLEIIADRARMGVPELAPYETFVLDTVSTIAKDGKAEMKDAQFALSPSNVNRFRFETEDHGENNERVRRIIRDLTKNTNRNVILTSHSKTVEPKGQVPKTFPDFSESFANTLGGMMDFVGYLYVATLDDGKEHRVLMVQSDGNIAAKTRITTMPPQIVDPTWEKIQGYVDSHNALVAAGEIEETRE